MRLSREANRRLRCFQYCQDVEVGDNAGFTGVLLAAKFGYTSNAWQLWQHLPQTTYVLWISEWISSRWWEINSYDSLAQVWRFSLALTTLLEIHRCGKTQSCSYLWPPRPNSLRPMDFMTFTNVLYRRALARLVLATVISRTLFRCSADVKDRSEKLTWHLTIWEDEVAKV